jgi:hypothetical protein
MIFVFGSNFLAGRHGAGAAYTARMQHGAIYGQGDGRQGNSFAIPTKDHYLITLPLELIDDYVKKFLNYARANTAETFQITRIGCGLAGYKDHQIAPMFKDAPPNCKLPKEWKEILNG